MSYKKRDKGHWHQGKGYKGQRKAKERVFAKREMQQQLDEQDDTFRYKKYTRTPNKKAQVEYRIGWYQQMIQEYKGNRQSSWLRYLHSGLKRAKNRLKKLLGKND